MAQTFEAGGSGPGTGNISGRDVLDAPPKHPRMRNAPRLSALAGTANSPDGEFEEPSLDESTDLDSHPVVQAFDYYQQARGYLQLVGTKMPAVLALVTDFITTLDQLVPQAGAAMLSGGALGMGASSAGAPAPMSAAGGPPMMGLGQLAGTGAGAMGAQPATPPMGMGMGMM